MVQQTSDVPEFDAIIVGAGPNGLTAAARIAVTGRRVGVFEAAPTIGGGARTDTLTLDGFRHDVCSAVHPLGAVSPAFAQLGLVAGSGTRSVHWCHAPIGLAHALNGGRAALLDRDTEVTRVSLGVDGARWERTFGWIDRHFDAITATAFRPLPSVPHHPFTLARFGVSAVQAATTFASRFGGDAAPALFAGVAAHTAAPLQSPLTSAAALLLATAMRRGGWPVARGGSQAIVDALAAVVRRNGGEIVCDRPVRAIAELPSARATLFDVSPRQLVNIAGEALPTRYRNSLLKFRHGPGVVKVDYALDTAVPWTNSNCAQAGTVHLGGTMLDVAAAVGTVARGAIAETPFVICGQPTLSDPSRAPAGKHVLWAYCHVPQGVDLRGREDHVADLIEARVEQFAPGFRERVLARHVMGPAAFEAHNRNLHGGDFAGGAAAGLQLLFRPRVARDPYRTPAAGIYLCSASTPPGGGVHGMCGWNAAGSALAHDLRE